MLRAIRDGVLSFAAAITTAVLAIAGVKRALKPGPTGAGEKEAGPATGERRIDEELHAPAEPSAGDSRPLQRPQSEPVKVPPGWHIPEPEHLPEPTYWPATMALGATLLLWGIVTSFIISLVGLALFGLSLAGWIREIIHENRSH